MMIKPKEHKDAYRAQEDRGSFEVPPSGTYLGVNIKLQRQKVGEKQTPVLKVWTRFLSVIETEDPAQMDDAKTWMGKDVQQSLWWDLTKKGNQERVACMGIACGMMDEWDPNDDKQIVSVITGIPYQIKAQRKEEEYQGKKRINFNVQATQTLSVDKRKEFTSAPDWSKTIGAPADRMLAKIDGGSDAKKGNASNASSGSTTKVQEVDPFGEIPF